MSVYVFVAVGDTVVEPFAVERAPTSGVIENEVAFVVVHESTDEPPVSIDVADASSVHEGDEGGGSTVMVPLHTTEPPAPRAVRVYE